VSRSNLWWHRPTDTYYSFVGEERDLYGRGWVRMENDAGLKALIDPLDLVRKDSDWVKPDA
jgi:hypothetical protein